MTGGLGADTFVAGDGLIGAYYLGQAYALVTDYSFIEGDVIQLGSTPFGEYTYEISDFGLGNQTLDTVISFNNDPIIALQDTTQFNWLI